MTLRPIGKGKEEGLEKEKFRMAVVSESAREGGGGEGMTSLKGDFRKG